MRVALYLAFFATAAYTQKVSRDGNCGSRSGQTCLKSSFGDCCSQYGYCGASSAYCGKGCQSKFGRCGGNIDSNGDGKLKSSRNGKCGKGTGLTCFGFNTQDTCCSQYGWCGGSNAYCGKGCQKGYGECGGTKSSSARASSTMRASPSSMHPSSVSTSTRSTLVTSTLSRAVTPAVSTTPTVTSTSASSSTMSSWVSSSSATSSTSAVASSTESSSSAAVSIPGTSSSGVASTTSATSTTVQATSTSTESSVIESSSSTATTPSLSSSEISLTTVSSTATSVSPTCSSTLVNIGVQHEGECSGICDTIAIVSGTCQTVSFDSGSSICTYRLFDGPCPTPSAISSAISSTFESSSSMLSSSTTESSSPSAPSTTPSPSASEVVSSSAVSSSAPAPTPTIGNPGFDAFAPGVAPSPWVLSGAASIASDTVLPKQSRPNACLFRTPTGRTGAISQMVDNLDSTKSYRIVFYHLKFDTPPANACTIRTTMGGSEISSVALQPPRSDGVFAKIVSNPFQPSASSLRLEITISCTAGQLNRSLMDDVSIEEVL
ncbi:hypothetical protein HBI25_198220 [Parastagonospora nodorum]|nr:hypothetical protein HBH47_194200 [Parastagonospora nodorum]KAH4596561.1 hypothetical protein HBH82_224530 [Parastagonospora nodorum]KAH4662854.1 hypothetical protein HBH78_215060 [Parastagonospora nodorum]KAH4692844.1 hypothetical protein HBH67_230000 [Parastagonospora nodorum]KAH4764819.1 hypothetical protein HBH63_185570 [Parastagonospora nodorum]